MVSKAKSFDGLTAFLNKSAINDKENKFKINTREPMVPRRQKMKLSQPGKFPGLSVSKSQILRRHTTYDKTSKAVHIHSWHKQVLIVMTGKTEVILFTKKRFAIQKYITAQLHTEKLLQH